MIKKREYNKAKKIVKTYEQQLLNKPAVIRGCQWTRTQYYNAKKYLREHSLVNWINGDMWDICLKTIREYEAYHNRV